MQLTRILGLLETEIAKATCPYRRGDIIEFRTADGNRDYAAVVEMIYFGLLEEKGAPRGDTLWAISYRQFRRDKKAQLCRDRRSTSSTSWPVTKGRIHKIEDPALRLAATAFGIKPIS